MDDFGRLWVAGVHTVQAEIGPHRRQAAKRLVASKAIPTIDALGLGAGVQQGEIVPRLGMTSGKHLTGHRAPQEPFQGLISSTPEVSGDARPVQVHVHRQGCGCGVIGEAALLLTDLGQAHAHTSQFFWHIHE